MRLLVMVISLVIVCAASVTAADEVCPPGTQPATLGAGVGSIQMAGDEAFDNCFIQAVGITAQQLSAFRAKGFSNADIAIAAALSKKINQPVEVVAAQYVLTPNWDTVTQHYGTCVADLGLSTDYMNKDNNVFNTAFIAQMYGKPVSDIQALRNQGFTWGEINLIANASARTGLSLQQVASMRLAGTTWATIATENNMPMTSLTVPCPVAAPRVFCCASVGAGPVCTRPVSPVIFDKAGNVLLTEDEAITYYAKGNDWTNVAIAANIARETGYPIWQILSDLRSGMTWEQTALYYGVPPAKAFNLANYPFPRRSIFSQSAEAKNLERIAQYQTASSVLGPTIITMPGMTSPSSAPSLPGAGASMPEIIVPSTTPQPVIVPSTTPQPVIVVPE